jgi:uncharacterized membrane protein YeiH
VLLHPMSPLVASAAGFVTILLLRLAAIRWRISLPEFSTKEE